MEKLTYSDTSDILTVLMMRESQINELLETAYTKEDKSFWKNELNNIKKLICKINSIQDTLLR